MNVSAASAANTYEGKMLSKIKDVTKQQGEAAMKLIDSAGPVKAAAPSGTGRLVDTTA